MVHQVLSFSLKRQWLIFAGTLLLILTGIWSAIHLGIDAVPDITSPQVRIDTLASALAADEVEQRVTFPLESEMAGLPGLIELRSLSRYGFCQVTMTFKDGVDIYHTRQMVTERLMKVSDMLPSGVQPKMAPIATGLGDIYFYILDYEKGAKDIPATREEQLRELRQIQESLVKPLLRLTPGVAEVNASGGYERQIVITPDINRLRSTGISFEELSETLRDNMENTGGGWVEISAEQLAIRVNGRVTTLDQIEKLPVSLRAGSTPVLIRDVASVGIGNAFRLGASTFNSREALLGGAIMMSGENSRQVAAAVDERISEIKGKLPPGIGIRTVYDRSELVNDTIRTVETSLFEGAVLVAVVLFILLGNIRAACIVALAIPLSMLFAITGMVQSKITGNLMSLGAIDFGLIVDGAVVMVENIIRRLSDRQHLLQRPLTAAERFQVIRTSSREVCGPMFFGVLIITVVYVPILALTGVEGKMFQPMALTVIFALIGSLILALTLIPVLCCTLLKGPFKEGDNRVIVLLKEFYAPLLQTALKYRRITVAASAILFVGALLIFSKLGAVFIPQLDEGCLSLQMIRSNSVGLASSLKLQQESEQYLLEEYTEISHLFSRIGTSDVASDPMGPNVADTYVFFKPRAQWPTREGSRLTKSELLKMMESDLEERFPQQGYLFTQPIQLRFNEIMAGSKADVSLKIFGDDVNTLERLAGEAREILREIQGAGEIDFDALGRNPMIEIIPKRDEMVRYRMHSGALNRAIEHAMAGVEVGSFIEGNRRTPVVIRLAENSRENISSLLDLPVRTEAGGLLPLGRVADVKVLDRVGTIHRESAHRRVSLMLNPGSRDLEGYVQEAQKLIGKKLKLPTGYYFEFGGQFKNLEQAKMRLMIVVPSALLLIFVLIYVNFGSIKQSFLIFACVPLAVTGGIVALWMRGLPFSISAAVGFIALSGIATLNGIMLISYINQLRAAGASVRDAVIEGTLTRLRPKLMTALVASLGFIPMALSSGPGAEVQRPLATVVIGGIITSSFLTLILLPVLYDWAETSRAKNQ